ncbi:MAG: SagB/ThcOx family dehydrogenase [Nitrosopumilaceae archaeon]
MENYDTEAAWYYHNGTKHPNGIMLRRPHYYDPAHRPVPYKIYKDLHTIVLPKLKSLTNFPAIKAISTNIKQDGKQISDVSTLASILYFSDGITKTIKFPRIGEFEFRAASCTGALYHIEIYVVCKTIAGLDAGVYHFDPKQMKLSLLRLGDYRDVLVRASGYDTAVTHASLILVYTDIFSRNTVKYQAREYRHAFWDCGTIIANTLAISTAHGLSSKVVAGFVDDSVNSLLGLNKEKEVSLALVPIGFTDSVSDEIPDVSQLQLHTEPISNYDVDYPEIIEMHESSSLKKISEVQDWQSNTPKIAIHKAENIIPLFPLAEDQLQNPIENVIIKRGSTRVFSRQSISFEELSTIIYRSTQGVAADFLEPYGSSLIDLYVIINAVDGLKPGSYVYNKEQNGLQLIRVGEFRHVAGNLGLDQDLPADSSVSIFLMSDLNVVLKRFGNRGYRAAQLEASIIMGRFYLASYALKLGATGLTFYDDSVTSFFSPHAKDKSTMLLVAIGIKNN